MWAKGAALAEGLNFADITRACEDAIKDALVHDRLFVSQAGLVRAIEERKFAVTHKQISGE